MDVAVRNIVVNASTRLRNHASSCGVRAALVAPGRLTGHGCVHARPDRARLENQTATVARAVAFAIGQEQGMDVEEIVLALSPFLRDESRRS